MPKLKTKYITTVDDRRDYRVSCEKLESLIDFRPSRSVEDGFRELLSSFKSKILTEHDYESNTVDALTEFFGKNEINLIKN